MSNTNDKVQALLNFYASETAKKKPKGKKVSNEEFLKKYAALYLPDGVEKGHKIFRILPDKSGIPIKSLHVHDRRNEKGTYDKYLCLHENFEEDCPFCQARQKLYANGDNDLAKEFFPRKLFVAKVIDRDKEEEGVKFWRFTKTIFEQIVTIVEEKEFDLSDIENGIDIKIKLKKEGRKTVVSGIIDLAPSKLSDDADKQAEWLANDQEWQDVYKKYDYNFLKIIVEGGTPVYSKEANGGQGGYIDKDAAQEADNQDYANELSIGGPAAEAPVAEAPVSESETAVESASNEAAVDDDDLPF
jgi:hypothetical protein